MKLIKKLLLLALLTITMLTTLGTRLASARPIINGSIFISASCDGSDAAFLFVSGNFWEPDADVIITFEGVEMATAQADVSGIFQTSFSVSDLTADDYSITARADDYVISSTFTYPCDESVFSDLVSGTIFRPNGTPAAADLIVGIDNLYVGLRATTTDADGQYTFSEIPPIISSLISVCSELDGVLHSGERYVAAPNVQADITLAPDADGVCDRILPDPNACPLSSLTLPSIGDSTLLIEGEAGTLLEAFDGATGVELGSASIAGRENCGSAELVLNSTLVAYQSVRVEDSLGRRLFITTQAPRIPQISVSPTCTDDTSQMLAISGYDWDNGPVDIFWDDALIGTAQAANNIFQIELLQTNITEGVHSLYAQSASGSSTPTLIEHPCPTFGNFPFVTGTIYREASGVWLPVSGAEVRLDSAEFGISALTASQLDGTYFVPMPLSGEFNILACATIGDVTYSAVTPAVALASLDTDLFLQPSSVGCGGSPVPPLRPADLTVDAVRVTQLNDELWEVTATIRNASDNPVESSFFLDVFIEDSAADSSFALGTSNGYAQVDALAPREVVTQTVIASAPYAFGQTQQVHAVVDASNAIFETNELNNFKAVDFNSASEIETVAIFALAFDNPSFSDSNLTPQFAATLDGIINASVGAADKLAVVLADLDGIDNTQIAVVHNGEVEYIAGLPNSNGKLDFAITEYDMGDGVTLGGFLLWARESYPAATTTFSFNGHGSALMPDIDLDSLLDGRASTPIPLPSWIVATPDHTDTNPISMISPNDIAVALAMATDNGANPIAVVDLVHCFGLSIEEAYEVAPYTEAITGSPNYAYFDAINPGAVFASLDGSLAPTELASRIIETYDAQLPDDGYPRIMAAVDADALDQVKTNWDVVSAELVDQLAQNPDQTRSRMLNAYYSSGKYDTSFCAGDWALEAPDALSDMFDFASALALEFDDLPSLANAARQSADALNSAVVATIATSGEPWFAAAAEPPRWEFNGLGISLYTDLVGTVTPQGTLLSWQADWYSDLASAENPYPFRFVQRKGAGSWASVMEAFWQGRDTIADGCMTTFPPNLDSGELKLRELLNPKLDEAAVGVPVQPTVLLETDSVLRNVFVNFVIEHNGATVFTETLGTGHVFTGTHWLAADASWLPLQSGPYTVTVVADPGNFVHEDRENDNRIIFTGNVDASVTPLPGTPAASLQSGQQWVTDLSVPLTLEGERKAGESWRIESFTFADAESGVARPSLLTVDLLQASESSLTLSNTLKAGPVQLLISAETGAKRSPIPASLHFNYVPANAPIALDEVFCFPFAANVGDSIQVKLNVPSGENADMFMWFPNGFNAPQRVGTRMGDDAFLIDYAPSSGDYLLCVRGATPDGTRYTLTVVQNYADLFVHPSSAENDPATSVPSARYYITPANPTTSRAAAAITGSMPTTGPALPAQLLLALITAGLLLTLTVLGLAARKRPNKSC